MNEIQTYQPNKAEIQQITNDRQNAGVDAIHREVEVIEDAAKVVPILIDGGMAPAIYMPEHQPKKNGPQQGREAALSKAMAAAVYGATLGFGAAKSLQNVFTVHGQPSIYARTAVALVLSHGHDVWTVEAGPNSVTVAGRRKGSDHVEESTWDLDRATKAGFTSNQKYKSQPEEMLWAKAAMTICRRVFADVMEGVPYSVEEMDLEPKPVKATATRTDRAGNQRGGAGVMAALQSRKQEPEPEPAAEPTPEDDGTGDLVQQYLADIAAAETMDMLGQIAEAAQGQFGNTDDYQQIRESLNQRASEVQ